MIFRKAKEKDLATIVEMIADDELGTERENFQIPLLKKYLSAFQMIDSDSNQELIVISHFLADFHNYSVLHILIYKKKEIAKIKLITNYLDIK